MSRTQRRIRFGPPLQLLGIALILTAIVPAAYATADSKPAGAPCPTSPIAAARAGGGRAEGGHANLRVEGRLSARGELLGQVLTVEQPGASMLSVDLPAEASISEPVGDLIVFTSVGGSGGSEVRLLDAKTGCQTRLASPGEIVRSAVLAPDGAAVYVHSVTRGSRRDAGVARHDLASGSVEQVVPALPATSPIGLVFGTQLAWSLDGGTLAIQSCGAADCLTKLLNVSSGVLTTFDAPDQGGLIGVSAEHLISFAACAGLPCQVLSQDRATGTTFVLADEAYAATLTAGPDGRAQLTIETATGQIEVTL